MEKLIAVLIYTIICLLIVQGDPPTDISPNGTYRNTDSTTQGSIFLQNLNTVFSFLYREGPLNGSAVYGYGQFPDIVYGKFECYNMSQGDCGQCFNTVRNILKEEAPLAVGAQYWLNNTYYRCYLRYENYNFVPGYRLPDSSLAPSPSPGKGNTSNIGIIIGATLGGLAFLALLGIVAFFYLPKFRKTKTPPCDNDLQGSFEGPLVFKYQNLQNATNNFSEDHKLGQGGFGAVYKGVLSDGSIVAVKRLSLSSSQGKQEFVNEVSIITGIQQRNLAKLRGYCVKSDERMLVYEFLQNGSLDQALFNCHEGVVLDWPTRFNIAIGVARGLAYLHEESQIQIIHRDIKASNILLDKDLTPKISDFGISKLFDHDRSSVDTKIAGTYGYMAPEYAMGGRLTIKADVFSYGVLLLEIVSGKKCRDPKLPDEPGLLELLWSLYQENKLEELIDKRLQSNYSQTEALRAIHVSLLCTHEDETRRPNMSEVVAILLGYLVVSDLPTKPPWYFGLTNFKYGLGSSSSVYYKSTTRSTYTESSSDAGEKPLL